jgi:micrococcal nuclease
MMNFFTTLLTPVFVVLGMFSTPVEMPVEVQPDVQQEVLELQQKVQEFENQKSENEEGVELEEKLNESKALEVKKESVKVTPAQEPQKEIKSIDSKLIKPIPSIVKIPTNEYKVVSVVDGDTIKLNIKGTVETIRLIGIDTPETVHPSKPVECMGMEASNKAKELLLGKIVR